MKIDIAKKDLWELRELIRNAIYQQENCPNPSAWGRMSAVGRKAYKAIVRAQVKAFGHDWMADKSYFPDGAISGSSASSRGHVWECHHQWLESSRYGTWVGCETGSLMPPDVTWTAIEYCQICGETRQRLIPPNNNA